MSRRHIASLSLNKKPFLLGLAKRRKINGAKRDKAAKKTKGYSQSQADLLGGAGIIAHRGGDSICVME